MGTAKNLGVGERVYLRHPRKTDADAYIGLAKASRSFHRPWTRLKCDDEGFEGLLSRARQKTNDSLFLITKTDDALAGMFSLSQIFYGPFCNAYLGYWVGRAFSGQGYMQEGMSLVLRRAFRDLRLHRLEANIQPDNTASIKLVQRSGFRLEGYSPRYLKVGGRWRDHERWAITAEDWRAYRRERSSARGEPSRTGSRP